MSVTMAVRQVRCNECGELISISVSRKKRDVLCGFCKRTRRNPVVEQRHLNYWTRNYSQEWIQETAEMIWGRP